LSRSRLRWYSCGVLATGGNKRSYLLLLLSSSSL
jgi:hypothetical protein